MAREWFQEACDQQPDPQSGAQITRLTSAVCINTNVYCEQPYCSKDGNRITILRQSGWALDADAALIVADLTTLACTLIERSIPLRPCTSAWSGHLFYMRKPNELACLCLDTLEEQTVCSGLNLPANSEIYSVSPDLRYCIGRTLLPGPTVGVFRVDLETGQCETIFEHPEITNPHLQYNPVTGDQILIQHNRGSKMASDGTVTNRGDRDLGTTLILIDGDGSNLRTLAAGPPHTSGITGHECFVADTGKVAFTVTPGPNWTLDSRYPQGNLFTAAAGDEEPTVFAAPDHYFNHLCVSRCGTYFLCDSYPDGLPGRVALVIGNFQTGKHRTLMDNCGSSLSAAQYRHPHAYLTSENRHVVYNGDFEGAPHVYFASIPDGFLGSLD